MNDHESHQEALEPQMPGIPPPPPTPKRRAQPRARQAVRQAKRLATFDPQAQEERQTFRARLLADLRVPEADLPPAIIETINEAATRKVQRDALAAAVEKAQAGQGLANVRKQTVNPIVTARDRQGEELLRLLGVLEDWKAKSQPASTPHPLEFLSWRVQGQPAPVPVIPAQPDQAPVTPAAQPEAADPPREESTQAPTMPEDPQKPRPGRCAPCALVGLPECPHVAPPASAPSEPNPNPVMSDVFRKPISELTPEERAQHQLGVNLKGTPLDKLSLKQKIRLTRRRDLDDDPEFARLRRFDPPRVINLAGNPFGRRA